MLPKVSVIIPVFNTEAYVKKALQSICKQTILEIEIIVINDGSTDQSLNIINALAEHDPRIQVYSQKNQGLSITRNNGLSHAKGEFVYFMDSDDILTPEALEQCYQKCTQENLDFVFFDAENIIENNTYSGMDYTHQFNPEKQLYSGIDWLNFQLDTYTYRSPVWLNFIRKSYIEKLNLSFYPEIIHEDQLYTFMLYIHASRVGYIPVAFFKRRIRQDSIMTRKFSWKNIEGYFKVTYEILHFSHNHSLKIKNTADKYLRIMLNAVIWQAHVLNFSQKINIIHIGFKKGFLRYISLKNILIMFFKV